ncbi:hypothetical protein HanRHA438_Chr01g0036001 [Helianthus annuus]|nr:hypothetical protein HanRHA438_Chr01g0036001 [Helianthus annuus]
MFGFFFLRKKSTYPTLTAVIDTCSSCTEANNSSSSSRNASAASCLKRKF